MRSLLSSFVSPPTLIHTYLDKDIQRLHGSEFLWQVLGCADQNLRQEPRSPSHSNAAYSLRRSDITRDHLDCRQRPCQGIAHCPGGHIQRRLRRASPFHLSLDASEGQSNFRDCSESRLRLLLKCHCSTSAWHLSLPPPSLPRGSIPALINLFLTCETPESWSRPCIAFLSTDSLLANLLQFSLLHSFRFCPTFSPLYFFLNFVWERESTSGRGG